MAAISALRQAIRHVPIAVWAVGIGAFLLLLAPIYNGYPLVFPDTGTYIRQVLELYGSVDRPPYYGIALTLTNGAISLWISAIAQCIAISALIYATGKVICGESLTLGTSTALMAGLSLLTALPWVAGQIMPDVWSAGLVLLVFLRAFATSEPSRLQRILFVVAIAAATAFHFGNLPLLIGLIVVSAMILILRARRLSAAGAVLVDGTMSLALVVAAFLAFSLAIFGQAKLSPIGNIFFSARLIADGTAIPYLERSCPTQPIPFCGALTNRNLSSDDILWSSNSYLKDYGADIFAAERDAAEIVRNTLRTNLLAVLAASLRHTGTQLLAFNSFDTLCPETCGSESSVYRSIARHYRWEFESFTRSRQMTSTLPVGLSGVHVAVAWLAIAALPVLLIWSWRTKQAKYASLLLLVSASLVGNALIVGTFSQVHDRYQSRMIWLVPLIAGLALILWLGQRDLHWANKPQQNG